MTYLQCKTVDDFRTGFLNGEPIGWDQRLIPEVKKNWLQALRSGNYKQGRSALGAVKNGEVTYCCLGVLCEIQGLGYEPFEGVFRYFYRDTYETSVTPPGFSEAIGLVTAYGAIYYSFTFEGEPFWGEASLADLNDYGFSFNQIADMIEYFL